MGEKVIVRVMPNLAAMVGLGVSGLYANAKCTEQQKTEVTKLIAETDKCILLSSEDEIDRLTAISGSGPSYIFEVMRSYVLAQPSLLGLMTRLPVLWCWIRLQARSRRRVNRQTHWKSCALQ